MLEFIITHYIIFIIAAIILLLGLFGYMMDKKKYEQYRDELINEERALDVLEAQATVSNVAAAVPVAEDPTTGN